nr:FecR domain-containing protein [Aurantiacibacter rhizosphaerae]
MVEVAGSSMTIEEQASAWCIRLASGHLDPAEQAEFDEWISADDAHGKVFDRAQMAWRGLSAIADSPEIIAQRADALDALRRANRSRWSRKVQGNWQWAAALAASVLVAVLTVSLWSNFQTSAEVQPEVFATNVGQQQIVTLIDGSRLTLDAQTTVTVLYEDDRRVLTLEKGRAKFDVGKDADRPFSVTAGGRTTVATGTSFSVELLRQDMKVVLFEGQVKVAAAGSAPSARSVTLAPGEKLVANLSPLAVPRVEQADLLGAKAWEDGQLVFIDEPLVAVLEQVNRYSRTKIEIGDARVSGIRITGVFNAGDSRAFLDAITGLYPLKTQVNSDRVVIMSKILQD